MVNLPVRLIVQLTLLVNLELRNESYGRLLCCDTQESVYVRNCEYVLYVNLYLSVFVEVVRRRVLPGFGGGGACTDCGKGSQSRLGHLSYSNRKTINTM